MKKNLPTYIGVLSCCIALAAPHAADAKGLTRDMLSYEAERMVLANLQGGSFDIRPSGEDKGEQNMVYLTEDIAFDSFD